MKPTSNPPARLRRWLAAVAGLVVATALAAPRPASATVIPWLSLEEMTGRAEVIALGEVRSAEGGWSEDHRIIVTRVTVAIDRALKGGPRASVTFEVPGGRADGQLMIASGAPAFRAGERVVIFLETAGLGAAAHLAVVGWNLGAMDVARDPYSGRDVVRDRTGNALYVGHDGRVVRPEPRRGGPAELGAFLDEVTRLAAEGGRPAAERATP